MPTGLFQPFQGTSIDENRGRQLWLLFHDISLDKTPKLRMYSWKVCSLGNIFYLWYLSMSKIVQRKRFPIFHVFQFLTTYREMRVTVADLDSR